MLRIINRQQYTISEEELFDLQDHVLASAINSNNRTFPEDVTVFLNALSEYMQNAELYASKFDSHDERARNINVFKRISELASELASDNGFLLKDVKPFLQCIADLAFFYQIVENPNVRIINPSVIKQQLQELAVKYDTYDRILENHNETHTDSDDDDDYISNPFGFVRDSIKNVVNHLDLFQTLKQSFLNNFFTQATPKKISETLTFLKNNIQFFCFLFEEPVEHVSNWAKNNSELSGEFFNKMQEQIFVVPMMRGLFRFALVGNLEGTIYGLKKGYEERMHNFLNDYPAILELLHQNIDNPAIKKWYEDYQEQISEKKDELVYGQTPMRG